MIQDNPWFVGSLFLSPGCPAKKSLLAAYRLGTDLLKLTNIAIIITKTFIYFDMTGFKSNR